MQVLINNVDKSNYVTSISNIPMATGNKSYALYTPSLNISIAKTISTAPVLNDQINIKISDDIYYKGYIENVSFDYKLETYKCNISHIFQRLKNKKVSKSNLYSKIQTGRIYTAESYIPERFDYSDTQKWVNIIFLIKCMFEDITSMTCITSRLSEITSEYKNKNATQINLFAYRVFMPALWSIGQEKSRYFQDIENSEDYTALSINYFDLIDLYLKIFKISITIEDDQIYLNHISKTEQTEITDNKIYATSEKVTINNYLGFSFSYNLPNELLATAYESSGSSYDLVSAEISRGFAPFKSLSLPSNFMMSYSITSSLISTITVSTFMGVGYGTLPYSHMEYECNADYKIKQRTTDRNLNCQYFNNVFSIKSEESKVQILEFLLFEIKSINITNGDTDVPVDFALEIEFTTPPDPNFLEFNVVEGSNTYALIATKINDYTYSFVKATPYSYSTTYQFQIFGSGAGSTNIRNMYNRKLQWDYDYNVLNFTTENGGLE